MGVDDYIFDPNEVKHHKYLGKEINNILSKNECSDICYFKAIIFYNQSHV